MVWVGLVFFLLGGGNCLIVLVFFWLYSFVCCFRVVCVFFWLAFCFGLVWLFFSFKFSWASLVGVGCFLVLGFGWAFAGCLIG